MTWLTEDPTLVLTLGAMTVAVLVIVLFKTGRAVMLVAIVGAVAVTGLCVLVERLIVTDREEVEITIDAVVTALQDNDAEAVLQHVAPDATSVRLRARGVLLLVNIEEVRITKGPEIVIHTLTSPPTAEVEMVVVGKGTLRIGATMHNQYPVELYLTLRREEDRWLIETAQHNMPFGQSGE